MSALYKTIGCTWASNNLKNTSNEWFPSLCSLLNILTTAFPLIKISVVVNESLPVPDMIRNWCCSLNMLRYETVPVLLSSLCRATAARKLINKAGLETFSSCLWYTCETVYRNMVAAVKREHHAHWTAQNRRLSLSTRGWAVESSSRQCISSNATFDCSSSSHVWVCRRLTLASVVQHLPLRRRNRPAQFLQQWPCRTSHINRCVAFIP